MRLRMIATVDVVIIVVVIVVVVVVVIVFSFAAFRNPAGLYSSGSSNVCANCPGNDQQAIDRAVRSLFPLRLLEAVESIN